MLRTAQVLPESLRACATLPSWETRPISFLVVSPRELCYSLFWMHSLGSRASGIGMLICFTAHLQLKRMTCEFRRAGPSDSPPVVSENPPTKVPSTIPVTFRTHPAWELRADSLIRKSQPISLINQDQ